MDYRLQLMTGVDLPINELGLVLHQPTIKEISYIGEVEFFIALQCLCLKKEQIVKDEVVLPNTNNFQVFMMVMTDTKAKDKKQMVINLLTVLFPDYKVSFTPRSVMLVKMQDKQPIVTTIDQDNFEILQGVIRQVFCKTSSLLKNESEYNPANKKAEEIAKKLMKGRQRVAELNGQEDASIFSQYLSILTIGLNSMSLQDLMELTMFQLFDLVERYSLYINWDLDIRTRLAGGKPDSSPDSWMKNIH